jgi:hypothetical protein
MQSRPFAALDCAGSYAYAQNFYLFLSNALGVSTPADNQHFYYYQHTPSPDETTAPCLQAHQARAKLDPKIQGGGTPLCTLMGYASSNSATNPVDSKQFPPYLTMLLGTSYPITPSTPILNNLSTLLTTFGQPAMDASVQNLGYNGYVNFLNDYYLEQSKTPFAHCGSSAECPSLYYLPYTSQESLLKAWPPSTRYWGMSGGGGSGAGYQIEAFRPGSTTHYILLTGGGGGGGGNTTPEGLHTPQVSLINVGSGGGGGSQFAECFVTPEGNLNGLGLGAGKGAGLSAIEGQNIVYPAPLPTEYSFYPPNIHPTWTHQETLTAYGDQLSYLFRTLIPQLYNDGYTITITGGGGGGAGLEFLNASQEELQPPPVSIGYGFNFCYVFNKAQEYTSTDCISSSNASPSAVTLDDLIYENIGNYFNQGMNLAVSSCSGGYSNYACTCPIQHTYVICELTNLLVAHGYSSTDIPTWLINPHCNDAADTLLTHATLIEQLQQDGSLNQCTTSIENFLKVKTSTACTPPWTS